MAPLRTIRTIVANFHSLTIDDLVGAGRRSDIVVARHVTMYLCRELTGASWNVIGRLFGFDHVTIMRGSERVERELERSEDWRREVGHVRRLCEIAIKHDCEAVS